MRTLRALALAAVVVAPYGASLPNGFIYDDHEVILGQPAPRTLGQLARVFEEPHFRGLPYYRPVVRVTLLGQRALHGDVPALFHAVNAALLACAALLAYALLRLPAFGVADGPAWLAAALFALHPLSSSVVHPIASGRETLLPATLVLATFVCFLRGGGGWRAVSVVAFAGALFGKEASIVVPVLLVAADLLGLPADAPGRQPARWLVRYAPFAAVVAVYLAIRAALFAGSELHVAFLDDPLGPLRSFAFAMQTSFTPRTDLAYEPELAVWWSVPRLALASAATLALAFLSWREGPLLRRRAAFWGAWFVLSLLPTANLLRQEAPFDERYVFLAWLAWPALCALIATAHWHTRGVRRAVTLAAGVAIAGAALVSAGRAPAFHDDEAFASQWLRTNPASPEAHHTLGLVLLEAGREADAIAPLREAARLAPDSPEIHHNLGSALLATGKRAGARVEFETVLRLAPEHPEAQNNLGLIAVEEGRFDEAAAHYAAALRAAPDFVEAMNNRATLLARQGRLEAAAAELEHVLALDPGYADAHRNLAVVLSRLGRDDEARIQREAAARLER